MSKHNHLAVWVSIILSQVLGFVTYTYLLAKPWIEGQPLRWPKGMDEDMSNMEGSEMMMPFVWDVLGSILLCYFISWLVIRLNIASAGKGFELGIWIVLGVLVKAILGHYGFLDMSMPVMAIDFGFTAVVVLISAMIIGGWRKKESGAA